MMLTDFTASAELVQRKGSTFVVLAVPSTCSSSRPRVPSNVPLIAVAPRLSSTSMVVDEDPAMASSATLEGLVVL